MIKKTNLITSINNDELDVFQKQYINLVDIQDEISKLEDEGDKIDKRKKKSYNEWKNKINFFIDMYNAKCIYKTYNKVK
jgi:uncharacterized protein Yka (UPF0111/DUF47 family)